MRVTSVCVPPVSATGRTAPRALFVALAALLLSTTVLSTGCGEGDPIYVVINGDGGRTVTTLDAGPRTRDADDTQPALNTASKIEGFLEGKTLVMTGDDIPTHPNGFLQDINFGQATQCYHQVALSVLAGTWTTRSELGTLTGAPETGDVGTCDRDSVTTQLEFPSTAILINNVRGDGECFDLTATYAGFSQEGRGTIDADRQTVRLEFFFKDQALGHRCDGGDVGEANTVTLNEAPFMGDAVQVYRVEEQ